ncbi:MAG: dehydrogenase E1 component subunit alpha/beta [Bryobacterales bacterium]|jgi:2-oxoisovalerate dehydrogenase E1 component|nr:dehydrogenase E1 component subunit alpha/beta [Bryobacterales bacterium]
MASTAGQQPARETASRQSAAAEAAPVESPGPLRGVPVEDLKTAFRTMLLSRAIDDREILMKRQQKIHFQISAAGHEAIQTAAGMALRPGYDWFFPYYRDRASSTAMGWSAQAQLRQGVGVRTDTASGGRQMPSHWSSPELHIVSSSSPTGSHYLHGVGCADASLRMHPDRDEVTLVSTGEGATSQGEFWESLNIACLHKLPLVYLIQDNQYAISVPVEAQTAGGSISQLVRSFPSLHILEVDGTDFIASYLAMQEAVSYCRQRKGPAFVHAHVTRPYSHSLSDDERHYKSEEEREREALRDPLMRMAETLVATGIYTHQQVEQLRVEIEREVARLEMEVLAEPQPDPNGVLEFLYSPIVDPCSTAFDKPEDATPPGDSGAEGHGGGEPRTMLDSINLTLHEEMRRNPHMVVFGEDVADCSRSQHLPRVKGKGGVFKVTLGLQREFGDDRCFNSTLAEAAIVGRALGMALRGMKPVVEIQFFDYIWPAMMQIRDELATMRWRSYNGFSCPIVIRVPIGGYLNGGAVYHSQSGEVAFTHIPGIRVVFPSNASDACGLLRTAIRCDDPVLFLEHKRLYREPYNRAPHPGPNYTIPFGKARIAKPGNALTVITYGALVHKSLQAAAEIEAAYPGQSVEVIDLRSLSPYDWEAIRHSVEKTNRVLVAHEDTLSWGFGAEISARIADELFHRLDAPVGRVAAKDVWVAYNPMLENSILPQVQDLTREMRRILSY